MSEESISTLETPASVGEHTEWSAMDAPQRDTYLAGLHEQLAAEKDAETPDEPAGRSRDEGGRFAKTQEETSVNSDETSVVDDAVTGGTATHEESAHEWRDASVQDLAAAYGVDSETLAAIPSREVLDVVLKGIDKKAFMERQTVPGQQSVTQQQPVQQEGQQTAKGSVFDDLTKFKLPDSIDPDAAKPINDFVDAAAAENKALRNEIGGIKQMLVQQHVGTLRSTATANLQKLGYPALYGEPGKTLTAEQTANIAAVLDDHFQRGADLERRGGKPSPSPELLKRSVFAVHGEQIVTQAKQEHLTKLRAQSARRTGGGTTTSTAAPQGKTSLDRALNALPATLRELGLDQ